jgi:hypothetical protein
MPVKRGTKRSVENSTDAEPPKKKATGKRGTKAQAAATDAEKENTSPTSIPSDAETADNTGKEKKKRVYGLGLLF